MHVLKLDSHDLKLLEYFKPIIPMALFILLSHAAISEGREHVRENDSTT